MKRRTKTLLVVFISIFVGLPVLFTAIILIVAIVRAPEMQREAEKQRITDSIEDISRQAEAQRKYDSMLKANPNVFAPYNKSSTSTESEPDESDLPTTQPSATSSSSSTPYSGSSTIHTGPRGGQYYINSNGKKTYIKH